MTSPQSLALTEEVLIKLILGSVVAAAIGWQREVHGRPAGMRTHMLMMLGVILFSEASKVMGPTNPDRIASNIVTGVGFLGAGTILRMGAEIKGLTSAASIWATAAIGMTISLGGPYILVALVGTLLALFVLAIVDTLERRVKDTLRIRYMRIHVHNRHAIGGVIEAFASQRLRTESIKLLEGEAGLQLDVAVSGDPDTALQAASSVEGVSSAAWSS